MPKADIEVEVKFVTNQAGHQEPRPDLPNPMKRNKTVHYFTSDPSATVRIDFVPNPSQPSGSPLSPFVDTNGNVITSITNSDPPMKLQKDGEFSCRCFVTQNGKTFGWSEETPGAGGNHVVKGPNP